MWRVTAVASNTAHIHSTIWRWALASQLGNGDVPVTACLILRPRSAGAAVVAGVGTLGGVMSVGMGHTYEVSN